MDEPGLINQHIFKVIAEEYPQWFVYRHIERAMKWFRSIAADKSTTMGHIKRAHLSEAGLPLPPLPLVVRASATFDPIWNLTLRNEIENQTLADLRDTLLPRLISGRLRIPDAEKLLAEAPV